MAVFESSNIEIKGISFFILPLKVKVSANDAMYHICGHKQGM
jgi:hypothetical protein